MKDKKTAICIRLAMAKSKIKGNEMAELMGVTPTTVTRWRREGCPNIETLELVANLCGMTIDELIHLAD